MRHMDITAGMAFAADGATAAASAFNAAALIARRAGENAAARRSALLVLVIVCAGVAVQAVFAQALYSARRFDVDIAPFFSPGGWLASRAVLLAGTLLLSALILRGARR